MTNIINPEITEKKVCNIYVTAAHHQKVKIEAIRKGVTMRHLIKDIYSATPRDSYIYTEPKTVCDRVIGGIDPEIHISLKIEAVKQAVKLETVVFKMLSDYFAS
jgi:hypothetical protein